MSIQTAHTQSEMNYKTVCIYVRKFRLRNFRYTNDIAESSNSRVKYNRNRQAIVESSKRNLQVIAESSNRNRQVIVESSKSRVKN